MSKEHIGIIQHNDNIYACSPDLLVFATCMSKELFHDIFELIPDNSKIVNINEYNIIGSIKL